MKLVVKIFAYICIAILAVVVCFIGYVKLLMAPPLPLVKDSTSLLLKREKVGDNFYRCFETAFGPINKTFKNVDLFIHPADNKCHRY